MRDAAAERGVVGARFPVLAAPRRFSVLPRAGGVEWESASLPHRGCRHRLRRFREQAQLPSGEAPEGTIAKGAATEEVAAPIGPLDSPRRRQRNGDAARTACSADRGRDPFVRLHAHKPGATPESRGERLRRSRAAAPDLRTRFPSIQQLRLEFRFEGTGSHTPASQSHQLYPPARAFFEFPCPHADCDGQFDLTDVVRRTVADHAHASRGTIVCSGCRALDRGPKQPCQLQLVYSVTAVL